MPATVPEGAETVRVDVFVAPAVRRTGVRLNDSPSPAGDEEAVRVMLPAKLAKLWRVIVDVLPEPTGIVREFGLAAIVKSFPSTLTVTVVLCMIEPIVAFT